MKNQDLLRIFEVKSKHLGQRIRALRKEKGFSQMRLATEAGLDLSTIHRVETAKFDSSISTLSRIRDGLGVSWSTLLKDV